MAAALLVAGLLAAPGAAATMPPHAFNPLVEAQNYSITLERQRIYDTPQYQAQLSAVSAANLANALAIQAADPGRFFTDDVCWSQGNGCAGDIRLDNWASHGYGLVRPVLFTARDGATATRSRSTTTHGWTSASPTARGSTARTSGTAARGWWPTTAIRATTPTSPSTPRRTASVDRPEEPRPPRYGTTATAALRNDSERRATERPRAARYGTTATGA